MAKQNSWWVLFQAWKVQPEGDTVRQHTNMHAGDLDYACAYAYGLTISQNYNFMIIAKTNKREHKSFVNVQVSQGNFYCISMSFVPQKKSRSESCYLQWY